MLDIARGELDLGGRKLCAVSVDVDEIPCYAAIHGLEADGASKHAIFDRALPRMLELFADERVDATFFTVGQDLGRDENVKTVRAIAARGHEIASHSYGHRYALSRLTKDQIREDLTLAHDVLRDAAGRAPRGFRAPGYTITDTMFEVLSELGYLYDSSVFPCPPYFAAKATAIQLIRARGRTSHSIVDDPRVLTAPPSPYRVGRPYWSRGDGMLELPIGVTRGLRLPFIGTSVALAGEAGASALARQISGRSIVVFELHGIDVADRDDDGLAWLAPHQADLRRTAKDKEKALRAAIRTLRNDGYEFVTTEAAAQAALTAMHHRA